jgi:hypothetical protein
MAGQSRAGAALLLRAPRHVICAPAQFPCTLRLQALISACWAEDPAARPSAREVVQQLQAMDADFEAMDKANPRGIVATSAPGPGRADGAAGGGCCVVS